MFSKAVKFAAKGRVALIGPSGSGKSYTALTLAKVLAGDGRIAAVDTEHGSLSKYAHSPDCAPDCHNPDHFDFYVCEMSSYSPENFQAALKAAQDAKYSVFLCDSLSHFWVGKDGALEFVDNANARARDKMNGWKEFRPHERAMVDAMLASPMHVICTMRTKTDYQEIEENGKKKRVKIGLAPVQRDGLEYEFDMVGYMEDELFITDKTRCSTYAGKAIKRPTVEAFAPFAAWLQGAVRPEDKPIAPDLVQIIRLGLIDLNRKEEGAASWASKTRTKVLSELTAAEGNMLAESVAEWKAKAAIPAQPKGGNAA